MHLHHAHYTHITPISRQTLSHHHQVTPYHVTSLSITSHHTSQYPAHKAHIIATSHQYHIKYFLLYRTIFLSYHIEHTAGTSRPHCNISPACSIKPHHLHIATQNIKSKSQPYHNISYAYQLITLISHHFHTRLYHVYMKDFTLISHSYHDIPRP